MFDKEYYLRWYKDKSVEELRAIIYHNSIAIYSQNEEGARYLLTESEACAELVRQKVAAEEYMQKEDLNRMYSMREWEEANSARRQRAVLNLPAGTSYHGQLVVAVLDDAGTSLPATELRKWSDELTAMDDREYLKLLDALCNEEILYRSDNGKYSILSLCAPDLARTNLMLWLKKHLDFMQDGRDFSDNKKKQSFFLRMISTKKPTTEIDWIECTWTDYRKNQVPDNPKFHYGRAKHELSSFVKDGILNITPISDSDLNYYYFTMLGEKEGE